MYEEFFEEIFWEVAEEAGLTSWWEVFDSEVMDEVDARIASCFGVEDATEVAGYLDWYNEMAMEL